MDPLIPTGQPAPLFQLADLNGVLHRLEEYRGKVIVINFWSAECPHADRADQELLAYLKRWGESVRLLVVASNVNETSDLVRSVAAERGLPVPLLDSEAAVADLYRAVTTPHLFVVDPQGILRYQGAIDDVTFRQRKPTCFYLKEAVEAVLAGRIPDPAETSPYGCTIVRFLPS
jgi:peroxiredoxin